MASFILRQRWLIACSRWLRKLAQIGERRACSTRPAGEEPSWSGVATRMANSLEGVEPRFVLQSISARLKGFDIDPFGTWLAAISVVCSLAPFVRLAGRGAANLTEVRDSLALRAQESGSVRSRGWEPALRPGIAVAGARQRFARSIYGHANWYGVFTEAALHWLKPTGIVGYLDLYLHAIGPRLQGPSFAACGGSATPIRKFRKRARRGFRECPTRNDARDLPEGAAPLAGTVGFIEVSGEGHAVVRRKAGSFILPRSAHGPWLLPRSPSLAALSARRLRAMSYRLADYGYGVSTGPLVWNRHKDQFQIKHTHSAFPVIWAELVTSDWTLHLAQQKAQSRPVVCGEAT